MPNKSKANAKPVVQYFWAKVKIFPFSLVGLGFLLPITNLLGNILPPLVIANILRRLTHSDYIPGHVWQSFGRSIMIYASFIFFTGFISWRLIDLIVWRLEGNIQRNIVRDIFNNLTNKSADFHANHFSGSLVSQSNKLLGAYIRVADTTMFSTIPLISSLIFTGIIMAPKSLLYVILLFTFAVLYIVIAIVVSRTVRQAGAIHAKAESRQTGYLADVIGNVMAVKSFAGEAFEKHAFDKVSDHTYDKMQGVKNAHMKQMIYFSAVSRTISIAAVAVAIGSIVNSNADIATVFLILSYTSNIVDQLFQFSNNSLRNYNRAVGDASAMVKVLNEPTEIKDPSLPEKIRMFRGAIGFKDVSFTHNGAEDAIFKNMNLRIKPGEKVGLIGHSGSGKTTLTRLLLRFSDIQSGVIEIDGQDITCVAQSDLRQTISYVPQEPILFHRTIAENIGYGRPEATRQEIEAISRKANAEEFIKSLPKNYETIVGERGVKLSGGQRQRIAIARAMIKNAPILVLDEATSALDSESEALIQDALWKLMEGRTAIVIAHRLSTIQRMDRIIVMDDGKIVEEGSHKDLLYLKGVYAKLWDRQSGGFLED